jgi:hypothetical protein
MSGGAAAFNVTTARDFFSFIPVGPLISFTSALVILRPSLPGPHRLLEANHSQQHKAATDWNEEGSFSPGRL